MFFVFGMLLTNMGIIQFFELITRPFRWFGRCIIGLKNVLMGGEFEDAFDDEDDEYYDENEDDYDAEMEALEIANNHSKETMSNKRNESSQGETPEFLFDVPIDPFEKNKESQLKPLKKVSLGKKPEKSAEEHAENDSELDALISRAALSDSVKGNDVKESVIAAEPIDSGCNQLCVILIRNTRPPAILHTENGKEKDQITEHPGAEAGKARVCREAAQTERYGHKLCNHNTQRRNAHQQFYCLNGLFLSLSDLQRPYAAALLRQHLDKINAVKHRQHKKSKQWIRDNFFHGIFHHVTPEMNLVLAKSKT